MHGRLRGGARVRLVAALSNVFVLQPVPRHQPRAVHGGLLLLIEVEEQAQALSIKRVDVDAVAAAGGSGLRGFRFENIRIKYLFFRHCDLSPVPA